MPNKLLVLIIVLLQAGVYAQNNSPYSSYGIGEKGGLDHAAFSGVGNNAVNFISSDILNLSNPASYSFLKPQYPILSVGISSRLSTFSSDDVSEKSSITAIREMAFGLSFAKRFGLAFGLTPYSRRGYSFSQQSALGSDSVQYDYVGTGSVNKAFGGFSVNILNYDSLKFSVGANLGLLFGSVNNERRSFLINTFSSAGGVNYKTLRISSFHYELGAVLRKNFKGGHTATLAASFEPLQEVSGYQNDQLFFTTTDIDDPNSYSLLSETGDQKGKISIAPHYSIGVHYAKLFEDARKNGKIRKSEIAAFASFSMTDWTKFSTAFNDSVRTYNYPSTSSLHLGVQYTPETELMGSAAPKFFERTSYRIGFYQQTLPYTYNGVQLTEFGTTFGFGFPILIDKAAGSSIQFGFTYGKRGTNEPKSLNESFIGLNFGVAITPSFSDRWFIKRKLD